MKVLIASTPQELASRRELATRLVESLGWRPEIHDPSAARSVAQGLLPIADSDLVVAVVGWRRGARARAHDGWGGGPPGGAHPGGGGLAL
ncbi:MAG: hypothetical protein AAF725_23585, partial [Acidobacteriota bacterium]